MDEQKLIENAKEGNKFSLNMLLEEHYQMLYGFLLKMIGDEEVAKDITQDTMIKAVVNIKKFRGDSKFSTWLIRIGINTYKNHLKKYRTSTDSLNNDIRSLDNVEYQVETNEQVRRINEFLNKVKPIDRIVFTLKYYEGYEYHEISEMTGIKLGTCKSKIHYLLRKIKQEMEVS